VSGSLIRISSRDIEAEHRRIAANADVVRLFRRAGVLAADYLLMLDDLRHRAILVAPKGEPPPCRDEDDRKYLHCAQFAAVDYLVTHDRDLLDLNSIGDTPIVTPGEFLRQAQASGIEIAD